MGWGDDIMSTAWARRAKAENPDAAVYIGAEGKRIEWTEVFFHNPNITNPHFKPKETRAVFVPHHTGNRPYIQGTTDGRIIYNEHHRAEKGDIFLIEPELAWARAAIVETMGSLDRFVILEPHIKGTFAGNKAWIWDRWVEVAMRMQAPILQIGKDDKPLLPGARFLRTTEIRQAFAVLKYAALVVTTDGALHHAAAALNVPAVVIWGARTNPDILGYPFQRNIWVGEGVGCGAMAHCRHCREGMRRITADMVVKEIEAALG